jgi:hypothetical protein
MQAQLVYTLLQRPHKVSKAKAFIIAGGELLEKTLKLTVCFQGFVDLLLQIT